MIRVVTDFAPATCRIAAHQAMCIDTYHAFNGPAGKYAAPRLLECDQTHPNEAGHQLICPSAGAGSDGSTPARLGGREVNPPFGYALPARAPHRSGESAVEPRVAGPRIAAV